MTEPDRRPAAAAMFPGAPPQSAAGAPVAAPPGTPAEPHSHLRRLRALFAGRQPARLAAASFRSPTASRCLRAR